MNKPEQLQFLAHANALDEKSRAAVLVEMMPGDGWRITSFGPPAALVLLHHRLGRLIDSQYAAIDAASPPVATNLTKPQLAQVGGEP